MTAALWLLGVWLPGWWWQGWWQATESPKPRPDLTPAAVVRTVVDALQQYRSPMPNAGIFTAYRFASPANHAATGPYGNFLRLVKAPEYAPLLHQYRVEFGAIRAEADAAEEVVTVHLDDTRDASFVFRLSRQVEGSCRGCWMVDGVSSLGEKPR